MASIASSQGPYRRSQVVWSLWCTNAGPFRVVPMLSSVPKVFARRIAKMLEMGVGISDSERAGQPGIDQEYGLGDAFELGVAVDLIDVGINQLEAAAFVRGIRRHLREQCADMSGDPLPRRYMVLHPKTVREGHRIFDPVRPVSHYTKTIFPEPQFVDDQKSLFIAINGGRADGRPGGLRKNKCIVIEISETFLLLKSYLQQAPIVKRGRP